MKKVNVVAFKTPLWNRLKLLTNVHEYIIISQRWHKFKKLFSCHDVIKTVIVCL